MYEPVFYLGNILIICIYEYANMYQNTVFKLCHAVQLLLLVLFAPFSSRRELPVGYLCSTVGFFCMRLSVVVLSHPQINVPFSSDLGLELLLAPMTPTKFFTCI